MRLLAGRGVSVVVTVVGLVTFALGVGAGVIIVFATGAGGSTQPAALPSQSPRPTASAAVAPPLARSGSLTLDAACLRALSAAETVSADLRSAAVAARTFNAAGLDAIVRQLQVIQPNLRSALSACHAVAQAPPAGVTPSPSPVVVTPSPAASAASAAG